MDKTILIAADHRGFQLKKELMAWLTAHDYTPQDLGTDSEERCDAGDFAQKMAMAFKAGDAAFGLLICGTGQAMAMTANRYQHLRAALCAQTDVARLAREHNNANILVIGADFTPSDVAIACLEVFLTTPFLGGHYANRCEKLTNLGGL